MKTLIALTTAFRNFWLLCQGLVVLIVLDPGWGLYDGAVALVGSPEAVLRGAVVVALAGVLWEHFLGVLTRKRQSALARALLRLQPGLQHVGAIRILIRALSASDPTMVKSVHKELVKLSGKDLGADPLPWKQWLERQEKISKGQVELETDSNGTATSSDAPLDQEAGS